VQYDIHMLEFICFDFIRNVVLLNGLDG